MSKNYGVINEQGFVAGNNLGFNPLTESDKKVLNQKPNSDGKIEKSEEDKAKK